MTNQGRQLGINTKSHILWGTHLCVFLETPEELPSILGTYFKAGLENNESCLWITLGPSETQVAIAALKSLVTDLDYYMGKGQIEILDASQRYPGSGQTQADKLLSSLIEKEQQAINRGFDGLRISGNMLGLESRAWPNLAVEHETIMSSIVNGRRMIALCAYISTGHEAARVLDIASSHQITLVKHAGIWTALERSDHKGTEEALREGEESLRALVETTSDWIWEIDTTGIYTYASPKIKELLGYEPHEVIGKQPFDFMTPEEASRVSNEFVAILKKGSPFCGLENVNLHKDGHEVVLETSGVPILDGRRNLRGYRGIDRDITERKRVEEALRKSELKYRLLIENANEAISVICDGVVRFANPKHLQLSGYSAEELASRPFIDFLHPDDIPRVFEFHKQRLMGEPSPGVYPIRVFNKDGNVIWMEVNAVPIFWEGKSATLTFSTDITERKRMEEALRSSEAEYRLLAENVNEAIVVACNGMLTYVNRAAAEIVGYSIEELTSRSFIDLIHPADRQKIVERYETMPGGGTLSSDNAFRAITKDEKTVWVEASALPISWDGKSASLAFLTDITEHRRLADALKQSEEKLRAMLESVAEGIAVSDMEGNILEANEAAIRLFGGSKEKLLGINGFDLVAPSDFARSLEDYNTILREGHIGTRQYSFFRMDGTEYPAEVNVSLIRDVSGEPVGAICINRDITERKRMEDALRKSEAEYRLLVENANEAIVVICEGIICYANPKVTEHTGYSIEELMSISFIDLIHPDDKETILRNHERRLQGEPFPKGYTIKFIAKDGTTRWAETSAELVSWDDKPAVLLFVTDVTERKKVEESLRKSEAEYRLLVDNSNEGITVVCDGMVCYSNRRTSEMSGYTKEELLFRPFVDFLSPEDREKAVERYQLTVGSKQFPKDYSISFIDKFGNGKWVEVNSVLSTWEDKPATLNFVNDITERKRAEEALLKSEAEYRLLVENANEVIVVVCGDVVRFANRKTVEMSGYSREELLSMPFSNFIHPDDMAIMIEMHSQRLKGEPLTNSHPIRTIDKNGNIRWVDVNGVSITWEGQPATLNFVNDITERKRAEEALRKSEAEYRLLVENANEAIVVVCGDIVRFANPKAAEISGYSREELMSMPFSNFVYPDDIATMINRRSQRLEGKPFNIPYPIRTINKDGSIRWIEVNGVLITWEDKPATLNFVSDITEHKRMEEALQKSEAEYRLLVENANEAIIVAADGNFLFTNPKATEVTGYSKEELLATPFIDFIHPDDRQMVKERHLRRLRGERFPGVYPIRIIDKVGKTRWIELNSILVSWGDRPATLNFVNEITERMKAEKEAKKYRAELSRLSAHLQSVMEGERKRIAHEIHDELGQQLTALKMDLSWIGKNIPKKEEPLIEKIKAMSKYIDATIDTVRKISTDLRPAILDDFGLLAAIESHLEEFQRRTGIKCKVAPRSCEVDLGQGRNMALFRIVQEALTNVARHANAANVEVSLKQRNGSVVLQIKDDGRGVKDEEINSSKSIGIVGMRERARLYNGQMQIKGNPGKGTTVKVIIPCKEESSAEDISR
jgi:PAS domain S-box-containing protein